VLYQMAARQTSGRKIKRNHSSAIPRYIIALDTETLPHPEDLNGRRFAHRFRLAVAITGRYRDGKITAVQKHRLTSKAAVWRLIKQFSGMNYTTWIVCHNALFDMVISGLPEEFENASLSIDCPRSVRKQPSNGMERPDQTGIVCIESPPFILGVRVGASQGRCIIIDTLNWFQCPLADLGRNVGLEKLRMPQFADSDENWFAYCERDTEITFNSFVRLLQWVKDNDMGMFRWTGPAQAMAAFRHRFMEHDILAHDNLPAKIVERSAYFGGRFECWKLGPINETVHQYDVNSLFPSVMRDNLFPVALDNYTLPTRYDSAIGFGLDNSCIAEVEIETRTANYPLRLKQGVCYPVGRFKTTLAGPELMQAVESGIVRSARAICQYRLAPIFTKYVDALYQMRQQYKDSGNLLYDRFCKTLLNSLYGKFGQRSPNWVNVSGHEHALPWSTWVETNPITLEREVYRSVGYQVQKQQDREDRHHADMTVGEWSDHASRFGQGEIDSSFVAISAFVTAYARIRMNQLRTIAGDPNVLYQGVDSLVVTNAGRERLENARQISESQLGMLRLQLSANYGWINGCSDYSIGSKIVISGLARPTGNKQEIEALQRTFAIKPYLFSGVPCDTVTEQLSEWRKTATYWKGNANSDGYVTPLELPADTNCSSVEPKLDSTAVCAIA
jgi:hypothetical protein